VAGIDLDRYFEGKDLEELIRKTFDGLGLDVRGVISRSDLYEREGKSQHAFCTRIGREYPYDVRVLANVRPDANWMDAMLHEFGHAVYDRHINPRLPYLLRSFAHANTTEAIALMMGALVDDPGWLRSIAGADAGDLDADAEKLGVHRRVGRMVLTRFVLVMYHFEQALYADPDSEDLNRVWWDLVGRYFYVDRPPGRDEPDWAAVIHVAVAPVYYHNYMLGELISAQLRNYLESHITRGPFYDNEVAGRYLLESFFGPGARENWRDTVQRATGEPLNAEHFLEALR
jgi:peptidyl-dipeptidase A